jgi:hypothetical protein
MGTSSRAYGILYVSAQGHSARNSYERLGRLYTEGLPNPEELPIKRRDDGFHRCRVDNQHQDQALALVGGHTASVPYAGFLPSASGRGNREHAEGRRWIGNVLGQRHRHGYRIEGFLAFGTKSNAHRIDPAKKQVHCRKRPEQAAITTPAKRGIQELSSTGWRRAHLRRRRECLTHGGAELKWPDRLREEAGCPGTKSGITQVAIRRHDHDRNCHPTLVGLIAHVSKKLKPVTGHREICYHHFRPKTVRRCFAEDAE